MTVSAINTTLQSVGYVVGPLKARDFSFAGFTGFEDDEID